MRKPGTARISIVSVLLGETQKPYSLADFADFLKSEHSEENLEFWQSVVHYRQVALKHFPSRLRIHGSRASLGEPSQSVASLASVASYTRDPFELDQGTKDSLKAELDIIITVFLTPGGGKEVNLGDSVRKRIVNEITEKRNYHPDVFKLAIDKIFELMKTDSFPRFILRANQSAVKSGMQAVQLDRDGTSRNVIQKQGNALKGQSM